MERSKQHFEEANCSPRRRDHKHYRQCSPPVPQRSRKSCASNLRLFSGRQEKFFREVGVPVATRTTAPPKLDEKQMATFLERAEALAPRYRTVLLKEV